MEARRVAREFMCFLNEVDSRTEIREFDYGDFMRVAEFYLLTLREHLWAMNVHDFDQKFEDIQLYLQFTPDWEIDPTLARLNEDVQKIIENLNKNKAA
jgi:hypothetical protein